MSQDLKSQDWRSSASRQTELILGLLWVLFLCIGLFWWRLGSTGLVDETEPLFAEAARQMNLTGDWITPYFNGQTRFDKPPLVYWIMAIANSILGVNAWSARLPSALSATLLTGLSFYTLHRFGATGLQSEGHHHRKQQAQVAAWVGSTAIALNVQTLAWARTGVSDMLLSGCMGTALLAFFLGYAQVETPALQRRWYGWLYFLSGLAVLAKGPVGVVLPGLIIVVFLLLVGRLREVLQEMQIVRGAVFFLLLTVPWYVLVILANGQAYIDSFFGYHNFDRFTRVVNNHWGPWYFYFVIVPLSFLPWSVYLPVAIARLQFWKLNAWREVGRSQQLGFFALVWFVVIFGFFTGSSTKLPSYTLPLIPAAGILVGTAWSRQFWQAKPSRAVVWSHLGQVLFCSLIVAALFFAPGLAKQQPELREMPQFLATSKILWWAAIAWSSVAIASLILLLRRQSRWIWSVITAGFLAFLIFTLMPAMDYVDSVRQLPIRQLAATLNQVQQPKEPIVMIASKYSLVFYAQQQVMFVPRPSQVKQELRRLARRQRRQASLLIVGRDRKFEEAKLQPNQYELLEQRGQYQLVRMSMAQARQL
jgi:4-amino-4-deoxy-L-arabinose transferase-like glycosyltransferase